jgi:ABC-2 type transport system permease protein
MRTLGFLLRKEFLQILRNPGIIYIVFQSMTIQLLVLPFAANFEMKNINLSIVDHDHSAYSQRLMNKITSSGYFILTDYSPYYKKALTSIEKNKSDLIMEIPSGFERDLVRSQKTDILLSINAISGTKGGLAASYTTSIINDFNSDIRGQLIAYTRFNTIPVIEIVPSNWFNPHLNYRLYMVPGILVMLLTIIGTSLTSGNIVKEKEIGTMEQINVSPIKKVHFILSKIIPFWVIGMVVLTLGLIIAWLVYGIIPLGSYFTIFGFGAMYLIAMLGFGLLVSTYANTQQQSQFISFFFTLIFNMLCGLYTPITSMPQWAQDVAIFNPLKYFVEVMRQVVLKGSHFTDILPQFTAIIIFAVVFNTWAVLNYRKRL